MSTAVLADRRALLYLYVFLFQLNLWLPFTLVYLAARGVDLSTIGLLQVTQWWAIGAVSVMLFVLPYRSWRNSNRWGFA